MWNWKEVPEYGMLSCRMKKSVSLKKHSFLFFVFTEMMYVIE